MSLRDQIKANRTIKDNSLDTYMLALRKVYEAVEGEKIDELESNDFLKKYDDVMSYINNLPKLTSKKNKLTAVIVGLSTDKKDNSNLIDKYINDLSKFNEQYLSEMTKQKKSATQEANWMDYEDVIKIQNKIKREIVHQQFLKNKELTNPEFDLLQQYVLLSTYIEHPLRNDFADMQVIKHTAYKALDDDVKYENNYLVLGPKNIKKFHINNYKNVRSLGSKVFNISPKLNRLINVWLKYNTSGFYLVKSDRVKPLNSNDLTKYFNRLFKKQANGQKISSSMMRHIIISHELKDTPTLKQKEAKDKVTENKYLHSASMNQLYRKVD